MGCGAARILVAALTMGLMLASAQAQQSDPAGGFGGGGKHHAKTEKTATPAAPKADDKAYKAALKDLPDKQFDAWHGVR
jgi:hypothetical protein